jgi:predicted component of type VI protein secretion system
VTVSINISGDTAREALAELRGFAEPLFALEAENNTQRNFEAVLKEAEAVLNQVPAGVPAAAAEPAKPPRTRKAKTEAPQISTGESRVGPEDAPETAAQDATDEAAETAVKSDAPLDHDDVRKAFGRYMTAYGFEAAQQDGPKIVGCAKISDMKTDPAVLSAAITAVDAAIAANPFSRTKVA